MPFGPSNEVVVIRKEVYFESFIFLSGFSINRGLLFTVLHHEGKCFCGKKIFGNIFKC